MTAAAARRVRPSRRAGRLSLAAVVVLFGLGGPVAPQAIRAAVDEVRIQSVQPSTLDPAAQSDVETAGITTQLYESLTTFDARLVLRPALAGSWDVASDGRRVVFHLRPGIVFSDGTPITAADVVGSWFRIIDPAKPSPLSTLLLDVHGVRDWLAGRSSDRASVGLRVEGPDVVVELDSAGADMPSIVASPTFGIVPKSVWSDGSPIPPTNQVVSGAYSVSNATATELTLTANPRYWAGRAAIDTVHLVTDIGGRSPVAAFEAGDVDYVEIAPTDASWIAYDETLGPALRQVPSLALTYLGFDTSRPPFNDVRVRQAVGEAVNWQRIVELASFSGQIPASSMVPPGISGVGKGGSNGWLPPHDPGTARSLLAQAGFAGGTGFPTVVLASGGLGFSEGIAADLKRELGITVRIEELENHFDRLATDPPAMWELGWVADYPAPNDFLGVLLGTGSSANYGRWSSAEFDAAVAQALGTRDQAAASTAFERALAIVQSDVPVVPLAYGDGWALSRAGLLGAGQNGLGFQRLASLAWAP